jgi:hypothetical protein
MTNPIAEAQGFVADYDYPWLANDNDEAVRELARGARIMQSLLDEINRRLDDAANRLLQGAADSSAHVAYLETQARRAFEDTRMGTDAEIDAFLRWPQ